MWAVVEELKAVPEILCFTLKNDNFDINLIMRMSSRYKVEK